MSENIKKLVAMQYEVEAEKTVTFKKGHKYIYLVDPETGKYYEPNPGWEVTGEALEELFHEVPAS